MEFRTRGIPSRRSTSAPACVGQKRRRRRRTCRAIASASRALATDPEALRRFARETRITARLEHPSIVPVHDAGRSSDNAGYIFDVHTRTIASRVPTGSRLSSVQVAPEMTTAVDQTGTVIGLDLVSGVKWTTGHGPEATAFPQLSSDGKRVVGLSPRHVLVWSLDHPTEPAAVARWLDELTNARAPAGATALTWQ